MTQVLNLTEDEIAHFISLFQDFMQHAEVEELNYIRREASRQYQKSYYLHKATELGITLDYYIAEFT